MVRRLKAAGAIVLGQDQHAGIRLPAPTPTTMLFGADPQSMESGVEPGGFLRRLRRRGGDRHDAAGAGHRFRLLDPDAGGVLRHRRHPPDAGPNAELSDAARLGPRQVHGPLARDAEDAALMLDAMVGFTRISPISVAPPWQSALAELQRREDIKGLRIAYVSDIAGIGVEAEIDTICRDAAAALRNAGAQVEQIEFDASPGRAPYQTWRGFWMVGRQYERLEQIDAFGPNLKGNVEAGLKLGAVDFAAAERTRHAMFDRFRTLFERFDVLLTPAAPVKPYPVECQNRRRQGRLLPSIDPDRLRRLSKRRRRILCLTGAAAPGLSGPACRCRSLPADATRANLQHARGEPSLNGLRFTVSACWWPLAMFENSLSDIHHLADQACRPGARWTTTASPRP